MRTNRDRNWDLIGQHLAAEGSGKAPRMFSSRRTLFGIPSALDEELAKMEDIGMATEKRRSAASPTKGTKQGGPARVVHTIPPVFGADSQVLILGTMPSPKSRETGFYYSHPQNRFWRVMAALFDEPLPQTNAEKEALMRAHGIALWDVLAECVIEGAADGTIAECVPNDISWLLGQAPIQRIFCTGAKAAELYKKHCEPVTGMPATRLPSTSPANASVSLDQLIEAYQVIADAVR